MTAEGLTVEQLHMATILLGLRCQCSEHDSPPTDWGPGKHRESIPHHCECPFGLFELPDPEKAPTAYGYFMAERNELMRKLGGL